VDAPAHTNANPMSHNLQLLQILLQALSSIAIAGGLIFTAVQFRQARKAQLVANFSKLVELQYQLRQLRVERPEIASVYQHDVAHLTSEKDIREYFLNLMQLSLFEIAWYAHSEGQMSDDYFNSWARRMWEVTREESFRRMIHNPSMKIMHDDFEAYVHELVRADRPPGSAPRPRPAAPAAAPAAAVTPAPEAK
jgi:hypothetical protein